MLNQPFPTTPFAWHRVRFRSKAGQGGMIAAVSADAAGKPLDADHHTGLDASADWAEQSFCTRGKAGATHAVIRVNPPELAESVRDVAVEPIERPAVADWADRVWAAMPPLPACVAQPPSAVLLARRRPTAEGGCATQTVRVVMLGDSIVNDTGNSPWEVLVERRHPGLRLEVVTSVRGGTGCWYYRDEGRVKPYVLDFAPDLLMIGGISHSQDVEAIRSVIRQVRGAAPVRVQDNSTLEQVCNHVPAVERARHHQPGDNAPSSPSDILLMTGAFGKDRDPRVLPDWSPTVTPGDGSYRSRLMALAIEEGCGFLDLEGAWGAYLLGVEQPYAWFMRDAVHANTRGAQLLARILEGYFSSEKA